MGPATAAVEGFSVDSLEDPDHLHSSRTTVKRRGACHGVCCRCVSRCMLQSTTHSSGLARTMHERLQQAPRPWHTPTVHKTSARALRRSAAAECCRKTNAAMGLRGGMRGGMEGSGSAVRACARLDGTASCKRAMGGLACSACVRHTPARPALRLSRSKTTASVVRVTTAFERRSSRTPTQRWTCRDLAHSHRSRRWRASQ